MIKLVNVNKYYQSGNDKIHVINNLNYTFPNTGLIFILGPSGSGKSTLLNLLGGLDTPDSGEIWIENRQLSSLSKKEKNNYLNSYLGFVFQEYNILKDLNLSQNISLSLEIQGYKKKEIKQKTKQIIHDVELDGLEKRKVSQLSGGQKQRIAIARALVKDPSLIIADEPTGNLDSETSTKIFQLFKKLSQDRLIIIVTHDDESAQMYGDDILRIDTANIDSNNEESLEIENSSVSTIPLLKSDRKLYLENSKVPLGTIHRIAFKNIWKKKFRYLLIMIIASISLAFLAFAIELNGDKLYQNAYTMVNNNNHYTDIYQYRPSQATTNNDFYSKYEKGNLMDNSYAIIKQFSPDLIIHKYQKVSINYAKYLIEKANFLYSGKIDTIILFDPSNAYKLIAGRLPNSSEAEILITDFLLDAFKHFGIFDKNAQIYDVLNKQIDLGYDIDFKIVGVIESNYKDWIHLNRLSLSYEIDPYDKDFQGFEYDYLMMNSIVVGNNYYDYILNTAFQNTKVSVNQYELIDSSLMSYHNQPILVGNAPQSADEIVLPFSLAKDVLHITDWRYQSYDNNWKYNYLTTNFITPGTIIPVLTKYNEFKTDSGDVELFASANFKIVGFTSGNDFLVHPTGYANYSETILESKVKNDEERIIVELPNDPKLFLKQFKQVYNNDYHFIIDIFLYKDQIESYNVDPLIEFASTGGLIVFTIMTIGIMWTVISIEIVDSKKEIGIMRSIGLNGKQVSTIFIIQMLFINLLAYCISIPLAHYAIQYFGSGITDALGEIQLALYTMTYRTPLYLLVFVILITAISTSIPLFKIMSQKIINVINDRDK